MRTLPGAVSAAALAIVTTFIAFTDAHPWPAIRPVKLGASGTVTDLQLIGDGTGGTFACWADNRTGTYDVYLQHLNFFGSVMSGWAGSGNDVSPVTGDQRHPQMASDGSGGVLVCWDDGSNVRAARVTGAGTVSWSIAVTSSTFQSITPLIVSDLSGGAVVSWFEPAHSFFRAQRVNGAGSILWAPGGVVASGEVQELRQDLASDGAGGAIIAFASASHLWLQHLAPSNGLRTWSPPGVDMGSASIDSPPALASDGSGGAYVAATVVSGTSVDIIAGHVPSSGFGAISSILCNAPFTQVSPRIASSGDGAVVAWLDRRANLGTADWYAARLLADGTVDPCGWPNNGTLVLAAVANDEQPGFNRGVSDGNGGVLLSARSATGAIVGRRVLRDAVLDAQTTIPVASGLSPRLTSVLPGVAVTAWVEGSDINAQQLAYSTTPGPTVTATTGVRSVRLDWTGPPADPLMGAAASFQVRYSSTPITEANFAAATDMGDVPVAGAPGTPYCASTATPACGTYYFAVRTLYAQCNGPSLLTTLSANAKCSGNTFVICDAGVRAELPADEAGATATPGALALGTPEPNPSSGAMRLSFSVPSILEHQEFDLSIFDLTGRRVRRIDAGTSRAGSFSAAWDRRDETGRRMQAGAYFVRLRIGTTVRSRSLLIVD